MKRFLSILILSFLFFSFNNTVAQEDSATSKHKKKKFEFELLDYKKTKKLKEGKYIHVRSFIGDTIIHHEGNLTNLSNDSIFLDITSETIMIGDENNREDEIIQYHVKEFPYVESKSFGVPILKNQEISYNSTMYDISGTLLVSSFFSGFIVAPLISINKSKPDNFDTKRYVNVVKYSFFSAALSYTFTIITSSPKLKAKPKVY